MTLLTQKGTVKVQEITVAGYEKVYKVEDPSVGLEGIICLHSTALGPTLGGIRMYPYANLDEALNDVKRLSEAMTYKASISGCALGGGKSVIIAKPGQDKEAVLRSFAAAIESIGGAYIGAEDVGTTPADILILSQHTRYVTGLPHAKSSGNPSSFTAWGVYKGIQASLKKVFGTSSVRGKVVAIQGVGSVGAFLAEMLFWNGAKLIVTDVAEERAKELARRYGGKYLPKEEILFAECDVLAPCALGGIINEDVIPKLNCKIIAGATNNQLLKEEDGDLLVKRGILYAPDFVINAGGLLNVAEEIDAEGYCAVRARDKIEEIYDKLLMIFDLAEKDNSSTDVAAKKIAKRRVENREGARETPPYFHHSL